MTQIILDSDMRGKLHNLKQPLELCDESGTVLARLIPVLDPSQYEAVEEPISEEELQRRRQETTWYTTKQVMEKLEKL